MRVRERGACTETHTYVRVQQLTFVAVMSQRVREDETDRTIRTKQLYGQTMDALFVASNLRG